MKTPKFTWFCFLLATALTWKTAAQTPTNFPVVTLRATDPLASWAGDTGTFSVFRDGPTDATLNVFCRIGGTASNGVDYALISNWITIPAGVRSNGVVITPINNGQTETKTAALELTQSPLMSPVNYVIGTAHSGVVYIAGARTNIPPSVKLASPTNGATFYTPVDLTIRAEASDLDGYVATVEFFENGISLGVRTNNPLAGSPVNPFMLTWSNVPPGSYALTAQATDNRGASTLSNPVKITVLQGPPPPPTNIPPVVRIASPANGAMFRGPLNLPIYAFASDRDGSIASVEFFAGSNSLGFGKPLGDGIIITNPVPRYPSNLFVLVWSNAPVGSYSLTAKATDDGGAATTSEAVNITILPPPPPPTNRPTLVSIIASDPIAVEGTNCWIFPGITNKPPNWSNWPVAVCRCFTNCGPKNATFKVRRAGPTNDDLTVTYALGGTATNGVDYVALPGTVTIPAGQRNALITIVPIDDGPPDISSTVIIKLTPATNDPPSYLLGDPRRAAALIIDSGGPLPLTGVLADRCFHLRTDGPDGGWFRIECSTNMVYWSPICTNQVIGGSIDYVDPDAQGKPNRFYRAVPESNPSQD